MSVRLKGPGGEVVDVPDDQVETLTARGYTRPDTGFESTPTPDNSITGKAVAGITSAASGATLGLSDMAIRGFGTKGQVDYVRAAREAHPLISTAGNVAGALLPSLLTAGEAAPVSLAGDAGAAVRGALGGTGLVARTAGAAAEGGVFGLGNGVSQLALSDDPLTVDHIVSTLSSNTLLGAGAGGLAGGATYLGGKLLTKAADKLAEASAARTALSEVPEDLAGLDEKGLREAATAEKANLKAQADAERAALEDARVPQRAQLADDIKALHADLAKERPVYSALLDSDAKSLNPALKDIEGVSDARVQLAKSFKSIRAGLDSPISLARDATSMIRPLEQRQAALEVMQAKSGEIRAALGDDARAAALDHVDSALADTKEQIARIQSLSKATPVASDKLAVLTSGTSPRLEAIEAARDALKKAPELGIIGKGAKGAAFAGGTALAHMIPGVGIAAPFVGKYASDAVGKLFERLAGDTAASAGKMAEAAKTFLSTASEKAPAVAATTATHVLSNVRFGLEAAQPQRSTGNALADAYHARSAELRQQTQYDQTGQLVMRPEARQALAQRLSPIAAVNPVLADRIETSVARRTVYMASKLPKRPEVGNMQIGPDNWRPSDMAMRSWARTVRACEDPAGVEARLSHGAVTPEDAEAYRVCYPERFAALQQSIMLAAPKLNNTLPIAKKVSLYVFTGIPTMPTLQPNVLQVLQGNYANEKGSEGGTQAPRPMPEFGAMGSPRSLDKPTAAQRREIGG